MDTVSSALTADAPSDGEEGGSHSGPATTNIFSLTSGPEDTLAPPHDAKEAYRRDLEAYPGDQSSRIKARHPRHPWSQASLNSTSPGEPLWTISGSWRIAPSK